MPHMGGIALLYKDMMFHNIEELEKKENISGLFLQRFPHAVREKLYSHARLIATQSVGCEIRFVNEDKNELRLAIGVWGQGDVAIFKGDYLYETIHFEGSKDHIMLLAEPERFKDVAFETLNSKQSSFSSNVWRICFGRLNGIFYGLENFGFDVRPPRADEVPKKKWLAYGSSITQGMKSSSYWNSYIAQTAQRLQVDVCNKGMGGSCFIEPEMADYIAEGIEWDFATLELGVNVRSEYTPDEFEKKVRYMTKKLLETAKPFAFITIYPNRHTYFVNSVCSISVNERAFNNILARVAKEYNIPLINGESILDDFSYLSADLIHPSDFGHMKMAENLETVLRTIIEWD